MDCLKDNYTFLGATTKYSHNQYTQIPCILIRICLGILLILNADAYEQYRTLFIILVIGFSIKSFYLWMKNIKTWKGYSRMIITYLASMCLLSQGKHEAGGTLIIVDALISMQSRYTYNAINTCLKT